MIRLGRCLLLENTVGDRRTICSRSSGLKSKERLKQLNAIGEKHRELALIFTIVATMVYLTMFHVVHIPK